MVLRVFLLAVGVLLASGPATASQAVAPLGAHAPHLADGVGVKHFGATAAILGRGAAASPVMSVGTGSWSLNAGGGVRGAGGMVLIGAGALLTTLAGIVAAVSVPALFAAFEYSDGYGMMGTMLGVMGLAVSIPAIILGVVMVKAGVRLVRGPRFGPTAWANAESAGVGVTGRF